MPQTLQVQTESQNRPTAESNRLPDDGDTRMGFGFDFSNFHEGTLMETGKKRRRMGRSHRQRRMKEARDIEESLPHYAEVMATGQRQCSCSTVDQAPVKIYCIGIMCKDSNKSRCLFTNIYQCQRRNGSQDASVSGGVLDCWQRVTFLLHRGDLRSPILSSFSTSGKVSIMRRIQRRKDMWLACTHSIVVCCRGS